jgi:hypothetical protein
VVREADEEPDPLRAFNLTKPAYQEAVKRGIAFSMLPKQYGGGGLSNVDFVIAAEEICAVDPGFATTILVNGLGLMPVWHGGTEGTLHLPGHGGHLRRVHRRLCGQRAPRVARRDGKLRRPRHQRRGHVGDRDPGWRRVRGERP